MSKISAGADPKFEVHRGASGKFYVTLPSAKVLFQVVDAMAFQLTKV